MKIPEYSTKIFALDEDALIPQIMLDLILPV